MATNGGTARDAAAARRRRIAERGAERLSLITGRIDSISSSSPSPPNSDQQPLCDENTDSPLNTETANNDVGNDVQPEINNSDPITATTAETSIEPKNIQSFLVTSTEQQTPSISISNKPQNPESQTRLLETFSPNRLRPAITSSEKTRRNCSLIAALLVLLSYAGFPILGNSTIKNIILFKPLFLLIVTNITIVVAPLLLEKVKKEQRRSLTNEAGFANRIGTVLEWGLLAKTGMSALFMDCSVYSVIVVCGMSFLQNFGQCCQ